MKRTNVVLLVRPTGPKKTRPAYWAADHEGAPLWMTLDVEDSVIVGRSLGIWLEFAFPARDVNAAIRQWRTEWPGASWELCVLTLDLRTVGKRKPTRRKR